MDFVGSMRPATPLRALQLSCSACAGLAAIVLVAANEEREQQTQNALAALVNGSRSIRHGSDWQCA